MSISEVLDTLQETASQERTSVDDVLTAFGRRAYGPILFVIGVVSMSPVGAIPGASILLGSLVGILMVQYIVRNSSPWIPRWIKKKSVAGEKARAAIDKSKPYFEHVERVVRPRWPMLTNAPWTHIVGLTCVALALTMYPLALVPWGVMPPSLAIAVLGLGLMSTDGLLIAIGLAVSVPALGIPVWLLISGQVF